MCAYSARKKLAKVIAEYSTLNPDTSSDSPSVKSKGALFVSANADTKNIIADGNNGTIYHISSCASTIFVTFTSPTNNNTVIIINPIDTSYDIICAAALIAPKYAYFELLDHPDINIAYTLIDDTPNIYNIPILISDNTISSPYGTTANIINANVNAKIGPITNTVIFACDGNIVSLLKSFTASANGCSNPYIPTTFGPFLNCIAPKIFLSANVTYATDINSGTIITNILIKIEITIV
jgi:hypothetical protein